MASAAPRIITSSLASRSVSRRTPLHLFVGHVLLVRGEVPHVSERVFERAGAVAVELIRDRPQPLGARGLSLRGQRIHVLNINMDGDGRAAQRPRTQEAYFRVLVRQHDVGGRAPGNKLPE